MRRSVKERFAKFDEVCRAIIKAGREIEPVATNASAPSVQPQIEPFLGAPLGAGENAYATHVARGMAKLRAEQK